jgi:hypothetical protein
MEINWSIAGWIIAVLVFYTIGFYEGRGNGYKRRKREEEQERLKNPPAPVKVDEPGLLRIKNEEGTLTLDLDGARANTSALSTDQRKRLTELLMQMRPWLKDESKPAPATQAAPLPSQPAPLPRISPTPAARMKEATAVNSDQPAAPPDSIVAQIDSILQARIAGSLLEQRRVFLSQSPEGGVIVHVGLDKYSGVDEVPDAEITSVIRAAIAEWEKKYTPGL